MKNDGDGKEAINQILSAIVAIGGLFLIWTGTFYVKLNISVSACYSFLNRHCHDE